MTMNAARLDDNIAKNRYRDISPCKAQPSKFVYFSVPNLVINSLMTILKKLIAYQRKKYQLEVWIRFTFI